MPLMSLIFRLFFLKALLNNIFMNDLQDFVLLEHFSGDVQGQVIIVNHTTNEAEVLWYQPIAAEHDEHIADTESLMPFSLSKRSPQKKPNREWIAMLWIHTDLQRSAWLPSDLPSHWQGSCRTLHILPGLCHEGVWSKWTCSCSVILDKYISS